MPKHIPNSELRLEMIPDPESPHDDTFDLSERKLSQHFHKSILNKFSHIDPRDRILYALSEKYQEVTFLCETDNGHRWFENGKIVEI